MGGWTYGDLCCTDVHSDHDSARTSCRAGKQRIDPQAAAKVDDGLTGSDSGAWVWVADPLHPAHRVTGEIKLSVGVAEPLHHDAGHGDIAAELDRPLPSLLVRDSELLLVLGILV